jgi:hypothetical protein
MSDVNLYQLLGVARSATADEIKSAYRELVKRYHPDLFSSADAKAKATEKLRQINEAYAVLGHPERRRLYDQDSAPKPRTPRRASAASVRRKAPRSARPQRNVQSQTTKKPKLRLHISKKWAGYSVAVAIIALIAVYLGRSEPRLAVAWTLWEKLEVSSLKSASSTETNRPWTRLSEHASAGECSAALRKIVKDDERAGSRTVFDEKVGTMAITVYVEKQGAQIPHASAGDAKAETARELAGGGEADGWQAADLPNSSAADQTKLGSKRVRNLECRAIQRLESDSFFHRALRKLGVSS